MIKVTSLKIDAELWKEMRIQALREEITLSELFQKTFEEYMNKK